MKYSILMLIRLIKKLIKTCVGFVLLIFSASVLPVYAVETPPVVTPSSVPTAQDMLINISTQLPSLVRMVTALAFVMGVYFVVHGLFELKRFGESRTMMSHDRELKGPLVFILVGVLLIYLPTSVRIGLSSFWVNPNPYAYLQVESQWAELISVCFLVIQLIGIIAFIRGLVLMTHLAGHGQPGILSRAMSHIIGGILCINIYQFVQVIMVTLGIQT
ncbi:MAG TPA: hypothetical protein VJN02_06050 [Gammaproteobacteria bacterium]|nr:hypothetical protein [Gammaproteobacteria bacterium]